VVSVRPVTASSSTTGRRPRTLPREARRAAIVQGAMTAFAGKGMAATTVDDIVQAAGVAKGTFYLYFRTKDDVVTAVAEHLVAQIGREIEVLAAARDRSPIDRVTGVGAIIATIGSDAYERDLIEVYHRPENQAMHERMSEALLLRLLPLLQEAIEDGIAAGLFVAQDARMAASFVLGGFNRLHDLVGSPDDVERVSMGLNAFILRGLGHVGVEP
jgi:AcrR family transcriptional regulator